MRTDQVAVQQHVRRKPPDVLLQATAAPTDDEG
jgi:hypothetical protein